MLLLVSLSIASDPAFARNNSELDLACVRTWMSNNKDSTLNEILRKIMLVNTGIQSTQLAFQGIETIRNSELLAQGTDLIRQGANDAWQMCMLHPYTCAGLGLTAAGGTVVYYAASRNKKQQELEQEVKHLRRRIKETEDLFSKCKIK